MKTKKASVVNFYDLSLDWQKEAVSNLDDMAEETLYLEPKETSIPRTHILWDLSEALRQEGEYEGFKYNAVIGVSNNTAMLLNFDDSMEEAEYIII